MYIIVDLSSVRCFCLAGYTLYSLLKNDILVRHVSICELPVKGYINK